MSATKTASIITFWLGPALQSLGLALARKEWWYRGGPAVDEEIRARFGPEVDLACNGGLAEWEGTPEGAFGLILLLDQFTRNLFRGTPDAWRGGESDRAGSRPRAPQCFARRGCGGVETLCGSVDPGLDPASQHRSRVRALPTSQRHPRALQHASRRGVPGRRC